MADATVVRRVQTDFVYSNRGANELRQMARGARELRNASRSEREVLDGIKRTRREITAQQRREVVQLERARREQERIERVERRRARIRRTLMAPVGIAGAFGRGVGRMGGGLLSTSGLLVGGGLIGGALYGLKELIGFKADLETTQLAMSQVIMDAYETNPAFASFGSAAGAATKFLRGLRQEAVNTPATFEDLRDSAIQIIEPLAAAGASLGEVQKLSAAIATREKLTPGAIRGALARDVRQLLTGYATTAQIGSGRLRGLVPDTNRLVRAGRTDEALDLITRKLAISREAAEAFGNSFSGKLATLQDQAKEFLSEFGSPVFDWVKGKLGEWSKYLRENKGAVMEMARAFGQDLLTGVKATASAIGTIAGAIGDIVDGIGRIPSSLGLPAEYFGQVLRGKMPSLPGQRAGRAAMLAGAQADVFGMGVGLNGRRGAGFFDSIRAGAPWFSPMLDIAPSSLMADLMNERAGADRKMEFNFPGARINLTVQTDISDSARIAGPMIATAAREIVTRTIPGRIAIANGR